MDERDRQLFIIGKDVWTSITRNEVLATIESLHEAGVYSWPYDEFDILACGESRDIMTWIYRIDINDPNFKRLKEDNSNMDFTFRYYDIDPKDYSYQYSMGVYVNDKKVFLPHNSDELINLFTKITPEEARHMNDEAAASCIAVLICMLATKNIQKEVLERPKRYKDPTSNSGIKQIRNTQYKYITTIKVGKITEAMPSDGSRGPMRPHLRRGHVRNQHYGEGNKEIKKIFIQPVFVNADEGWIENQRKAYVVKAA